MNYSKYSEEEWKSMYLKYMDTVERNGKEELNHYTNLRPLDSKINRVDRNTY